MDLPWRVVGLLQRYSHFGRFGGNLPILQVCFQRAKDYAKDRWNRGGPLDWSRALRRPIGRLMALRKTQRSRKHSWVQRTQVSVWNNFMRITRNQNQHVRENAPAHQSPDWVAAALLPDTRVSAFRLPHSLDLNYFTLTVTCVRSQTRAKRAELRILSQELQAFTDRPKS